MPGSGDPESSQSDFFVPSGGRARPSRGEPFRSDPGAGARGGDDVSREGRPASREPSDVPRDAPLAERMRPRRFEEVLGQSDLTAPDSFLSRMLARGAPPSLLFWGPPGCGKTTLARLLAGRAPMAFRTLSAVTAGVKDVKAVIDEAEARRRGNGRRTILFVDEIHRFNKAQQDAFLPHVESGLIVLFGATTENPSFSVIPALLSRCRVIVLKAVPPEDLESLLRRALDDPERGLGASGVVADDDALAALAGLCDGDARRALNLLEQCALATPAPPPPPTEPGAASGAPPSPRRIDLPLVAEVARRTHFLYDKSGEEHFNLISALHKSLRASDPQAALYWLGRMLASGEDPLYVARRMVRFASEDVGMADPAALPLTLAAVEAYRMLGSPEGDLALSQAAVYLATAPRSNALYRAHGEVKEELQRSGSLPVPMHLRNAPTGLMKSLGYGDGYVYDHDAPGGRSGQRCLPEEIADTTFYRPTDRGAEAAIRARMESKPRATPKE